MSVLNVRIGVIPTKAWLSLKATLPPKTFQKQFCSIFPARQLLTSIPPWQAQTALEIGVHL
jgi:hypothetical protein